MSTIRYLAEYITASGTIVTVTLVSGPTQSTISRVAGQDSSSVQWQADGAFASYMIRVVPADTSPVSAGTLVEQDQAVAAGSGAGGTPYTSDITDAELEAASSGEGDKILKIFVRSPSGTWST